MKCPKCASKNLEPDPKELGQRICFNCGTLFTQQVKPHWKLVRIAMPLLFLSPIVLSFKFAPQLMPASVLVLILLFTIALIGNGRSIDLIEKPILKNESPDQNRNERIDYNVKFFRGFSWAFAAFDVFLIGAITFGINSEPIPERLLWSLVGFATFIAVLTLIFRLQANRYERMKTKPGTPK